MGLPLAARRVVRHAIAARPSRIAPQQIRGDARLVHTDVLPRIMHRLPRGPLAAGRRDISAPPFVGVDRSF